MKKKKPYWLIWIHSLANAACVADLIDTITFKDRYETEKSRDEAIKARLRQGHKIKEIGSD